jgi:putative transposase
MGGLRGYDGNKKLVGRKRHILVDTEGFLLAELGYESGFRVIPRTWVVERTFSWPGRQRRLSEDFERLAITEEVFIYLVGVRLHLARLAPAQSPFLAG